MIWRNVETEEGFAWYTQNLWIDLKNATENGKSLTSMEQHRWTVNGEIVQVKRQVQSAVDSCMFCCERHVLESADFGGSESVTWRFRSPHGGSVRVWSMDGRAISPVYRLFTHTVVWAVLVNNSRDVHQSQRDNSLP